MLSPVCGALFPDTFSVVLSSVVSEAAASVLSSVAGSSVLSLSFGVSITSPSSTGIVFTSLLPQ